MCNQMSVHCNEGKVEIPNTFNPKMYSLRNGLFFINCILTLAAGLLIAAGFEIIKVYNEFDLFLMLFYKVLARILISNGILLLAFTILGWFGIIKQHLLSIKVYFVSLLLMTCLNFVLVISSTIAFNNVEDQVDTKMFDSIKYFDADMNIKQAWNYMQEEYSCCGVNFPENWYGIKGTDGVALFQYKGFSIKLPCSCFNQGDCKNSTIFEDGCKKHIVNYWSKSTLFCSCISIILATIQIVAAALTYLFGKHVQHHLNISSIHKHLRGKSIVLVSHTIYEKPAFV